MREQVAGRFERMPEEFFLRFLGSLRCSSFSEGFAGLGNQSFPFLQSALFPFPASFELVIQSSVNPSLLTQGPVIERIGGPNGEVRIFTHLEGSDPFVDAQLLGRVEANEFESLGFGQASVFDGLGRFQVHAAGMIGGVRVETYDAPAFVHKSAGVGDGVIDFELVGPPIGKGRRPSSVPGNFVGYLVAFQNVLEAADPHAEALHGAQENKNFVLSVRVAMNESFAFDDFHDRLQFQVPPDWRDLACSSFKELRSVLTGRGETVREKGFDPHSGLGETRGVFVPPVGLLDVFPEGEFDPARGGFQNHPVRRSPEPELDHGVLSSDGVGRTMEQVAGGQPSCQLTFYIDAFRIDHVGDSYHGGGGHGGFVHPAENHGMAVTVD